MQFTLGIRVISDYYDTGEYTNSTFIICYIRVLEGETHAVNYVHSILHYYV